jgi:hypothetical protein
MRSTALPRLVPPPRVHRHRYFGARDRLLEIFAAALTVWTWPCADDPSTQLLAQGSAFTTGGFRPAADIRQTPDEVREAQLGRSLHFGRPATSS